MKPVQVAELEKSKSVVMERLRKVEGELTAESGEEVKEDGDYDEVPLRPTKV